MYVLHLGIKPNNATPNQPIHVKETPNLHAAMQSFPVAMPCHTAMLHDKCNTVVMQCNANANTKMYPSPINQQTPEIQQQYTTP